MMDEKSNSGRHRLNAQLAALLLWLAALTPSTQAQAETYKLVCAPLENPASNVFYFTVDLDRRVVERTYENSAPTVLNASITENTIKVVQPVTSGDPRRITWAVTIDRNLGTFLYEERHDGLSSQISGTCRRVTQKF